MMVIVNQLVPAMGGEGYSTIYLPILYIVCWCCVVG